MILVCKECGKEFESSREKKYCSEKCSNAYNCRSFYSKRNGDTKQRVRKCVQCGTEFTTTHRIKIYCSDKCKSEYMSPKKNSVVQCQYCGKEFVNVSGRAKYCSKECCDNYYRDRRQSFGVSVIECAICGKHFKSHASSAGRRKKYCSVKCVKKANSLRVTRAWTDKQLGTEDLEPNYSVEQYRAEMAEYRKQYVRLDNWNNAFTDSKSGYCRCCGNPINIDDAFQSKFCDYKCYRNYHVNKIVAVSYICS